MLSSTLITILIYTLSLTVQGSDEYQKLATHYGESYNGQRMGCGGFYRSSDSSILAVGPSFYSRFLDTGEPNPNFVPCGTQFQVTGPNGTITVQRTDSCPGCDRYNMIDLSEAGHAIVCGVGTCSVTLQRLD